MKCQKCGIEIHEKSRFCPHCGEKIDFKQNIDRETDNITDEPQEFVVPKETEKKKSFNSSKIMVRSIIFILVLSILVKSITVFNTPIKQYVRAIESGNEEKAHIIYIQEIENNPNKSESLKFQNELIEYVRNLYFRYNNGDIIYNDAYTYIQTIIDMKPQYGNLLTIMEKFKRNLQNLKKSKDIFDEGIKYSQNDENLEPAIKAFKKVIKEDTNYKKAQNQIETLSIKFKAITQKEIDDLISNEDYKNAYSKINNLINTIGEDSTLQYQKNYVSEKICADILKQAEQLVLDEKFYEAIKLLKDNSVYDVKKELNKRADEIKDNELKQQNIKKFKQLISKMDLVYDNSMGYYILYSDFNSKINENINTQPMISIKPEDNIIFSIKAGFKYTSWVSFKTITFLSANKNLSYDIPVDRRRINIDNNKAVEYTYLMHNTDSFGVNVDLLNLVNIIENSEDITICFLGESIKIEHTMTSQEKQDIIDLWELYKLIMEDNSLIFELNY